VDGTTIFEIALLTSASSVEPFAKANHLSLEKITGTSYGNVSVKSARKGDEALGLDIPPNPFYCIKLLRLKSDE
jgi:hypothetical protein